MNDDTLEPLARGEHVDLDTGTRVQRGGATGTSYPENFYHVRDEAAEGPASLVLEDEEIRQLAELAGYEVSER